MKIKSIKIHNFRTIKEAAVNLGDYSLMVGSNNAGKSNIMDAIRIFYEKEKWNEERDFPKFQVDDKESWIDIEFILSDNEYANLKDDYKGDANSLKVRKFLKTELKDSSGKIMGGIHGYISDKIADEFFYGAKNVSQGKFGDLIFIPAVSKLEEQTKLTGPSPLRELLNGILQKIINCSSSYNELKTSFEKFNSTIKQETTEDKKSLIGLENEINQEIKDWESKFEININPVDDTDIIKNLISFKIFDNSLEERLEAGQYGQGFQRHLIYTLILIAAKYQISCTPSAKKDFSPVMTLILFEEPEAFLHPIQQKLLSKGLNSISQEPSNQILMSSHSPHFVSYNTDDLTSIIKLNRYKNDTVIGQIDRDKLKEIFEDNKEILELLRDTGDAGTEDDFEENMEAIKYFLWLNEERCGLFFAGRVLLVEGASERVLINYLLNKNIVEITKGGVFVLDCLGKYNIHRFMNLLNAFHIRHCVLCDEDNGEKHKKINKFIEEKRNEYTRAIDFVTPHLEDYLGIEKTKPHRKPQHVMIKLQKGQIAKDKLESFTKKISNLVTI